MAMDIEVVHKAAGVDRFERALAVLVGLAAVVAALLGTLEVDSNKRQEQAQADGVRLTVQIFGTLAGSAPAADEGTQAGQVAILRNLQATARRLAANPLPATAGFESALADADQRAADDLGAVVDSVSTPPDAASGVDPVTRTVIASTTDDASKLLARQSRVLATANRFGSRGSRAVFGISILALAAVLFGLSAVLGRANRGSVTLALGAVALVGAAAMGASALRI
jgi:hypothetical protein